MLKNNFLVFSIFLLSMGIGEETTNTTPIFASSQNQFDYKDEQYVDGETLKEALTAENSNVLKDFNIDKEQLMVFNTTNPVFYEEFLTVDILENGKADVCTDIRAYESTVRDNLKKYGLESHTEFFLALLQKETGCEDNLVKGDIAQASESIGKQPNSIKNPYESLAVGTKYYAELINTYSEQNVDIRFVIHSYNYGERLIREAIQEDASYQINYIVEKSIAYKSDYFPNVKRKDSDWRPVGGEYGDLRYVANLFSIFTPESQL